MPAFLRVLYVDSPLQSRNINIYAVWRYFPWKAALTDRAVYWGKVALSSVRHFKFGR